MFDLGADVASYPDFMPWCGGAIVHKHDEHGMEASITISIAGIKQTFPTRNEHDYPNLIKFHLVDAPFAELTGTGEFIELAAAACKVGYIMEDAFCSSAREAVLGPVFNRIDRNSAV